MSKTVSTPQSDVDQPQNSATAFHEFSKLWEGAYASPPPEFLRHMDFSRPRAKDLLSYPVSHMGANASVKSFSKAASLFMFRKCLVSNQDPSSVVEGYLKKLASESTFNVGFGAAAVAAIPGLFPRGWDKEWKRYCDLAVISDGACTEVPKAQGGSRKFIIEKYGEAEFKRRLFNDGPTSLTDGIPSQDGVRKVCVVPDGGKLRIVTVASGEQNFLAPLHHMMYDQLVRKGGVLKGEATPASLEGFKRGEKSGVIVSGDYEAATDNIQIRHSLLLLDLIRLQSQHIPDAWFVRAKQSLTGKVQYEDRTPTEQTNAQMMGNYLSFPLLCLTNLLTVHRALGTKKAKELIKNGGCKVNGDDIVFRCTAEEYNSWLVAVSDCGLKVSLGKTLVHKRFFSLNSTFFRADHKGVYLVPVIRSASVLTPGGTDFWSVSSRMASTVQGWQGEPRARLLGACLRRFSGVFGCLGSRGGWGGSLLIHSRPVNVGALWKAGRVWIKRECECLAPVHVGWRQPRTHEKVGGDAPLVFSGPLEFEDAQAWISVHRSNYDVPTQEILKRTYESWCRRITWRAPRRKGGRSLELSCSTPYLRWSEFLKREFRVPMGSEPGYLTGVAFSKALKFKDLKITDEALSKREANRVMGVEKERSKEGLMVPLELSDRLKVVRETLRFSGGHELALGPISAGYREGVKVSCEESRINSQA